MTAERPGTPGTAWERELVRMAEIHVPEDEGAPFGWDEPGEREQQPNRATRRATRRAERRARPLTDADTQNPATRPQTGAQPFETEENH